MNKVGSLHYQLENLLKGKHLVPILFIDEVNRLRALLKDDNRQAALETSSTCNYTVQWSNSS